MANDPLDFVRIEESVSRALATEFEKMLGDTARQIEHKCTAHDFSGAYRLIDAIDLRGLVESHREEFMVKAVQAALFGANEVSPLHETYFVRDQVIPQHVINAVDQLVVMMETHCADMIRSDLRAVVYDEELTAKDELHSVSKEDLGRLYCRWNEVRHPGTNLLCAYLDRREEIELRGDPFLMGVHAFDDFSASPEQLQARAVLPVGPPKLSDPLGDLAFKWGNQFPYDDPWVHGPAGLQNPSFMIPDRPRGPDEVVMGDQHSPSSLQFLVNNLPSDAAHLQRLSADQGGALAESTLPRFESSPVGLQDAIWRFTSALMKNDLTEDDLAATGGLLEPAQGFGRRKKRRLKYANEPDFSDLGDERQDVADADDTTEDTTGWSQVNPIHPEVKKRFYRVVKDALAEGSLYVHRPLLNGEDIQAWAKSQGFTSTLDPDDMHVTICYSRSPVVGVTPLKGNITVWGGGREVEQFGKATVLHFTSSDLANRNFELQMLGATTDFPQFKSRITVSYNGAPDDATQVLPYGGDLVFGPEVHRQINEDWNTGGVTEVMLKAEELDLADKLNAATMGTGKKLFDIGANLTTSRLIAFGFLSQASQSGHTTYQINEILDDKTCPVCVFMNGKTFAVAHEYGKVLQALSAQDPKDLKSIAPWPNQSKNGLFKLYGMKADELQSAGYGSPPYHPHCRGFLTVAGTVTETIPNGSTSAEAVQEIIDGLQAESAEVVGDTLTDLKIPAEDAELQAHLNPVDELKPAIGGIEDVHSPADFVEMANNGWQDAQDAYRKAVDQVLDPDTQAMIQALIDNGDFKSAQAELGGLGFDLNDFYQVGDTGYLTQPTLNENAIGAHKFTDQDQAFYKALPAANLIDALAAIKDSPDYNDAFLAFIGDDYEKLDGLLIKNGVNIHDFDKVQKFDDNEARDKSGKWTAEGGVMSHDELRDRMWDAAEKLGFPKARVIMSDEAYPFVVDGQNYMAAATAQISDPTHGLITVYRNHVKRENLDGVMAHEVEHFKFANAILRNKEDEKALFAEPTPPGKDVWDTVLKPSGDVRPEYAGKYHNYQAFKEATRDITLLAQSDGVSPYSKAYWDGWHKRTVSTEIAMHETLAEMHRLKLATGKFPDHQFSGPFPRVRRSAEFPQGFATSKGTKTIVENGAKAWRKLYKVVNP